MKYIEAYVDPEPKQSVTITMPEYSRKVKTHLE
jgi:hypothetical protein